VTKQLWEAGANSRKKWNVGVCR